MVSSSECPPVLRNSLLDGIAQGVPAGLEELRHAADFVQILVAPHDLLARAQAHAHLAVDAAGVLGRGRQILLAAAYLKQVQELRFELLGRSAAAERTAIERGRAA